MGKKAVRKVVKSYYRSRLDNDVDECVSHFSPEARTRFAGSPDASPIAADYGGAESLRRMISQLVRDWEWRAQKIESMTIQDDRAAVLFFLETVFKPTGDEVRTEIMDLITVSEGKIIEYVEFVDTATVARLQAAASQS